MLNSSDFSNLKGRLVKKKFLKLLELQELSTFCLRNSDPGEARTLDPMIKSHLLYQLSYGVILLFASAKLGVIFIFANEIPLFL